MLRSGGTPAPTTGRGPVLMGLVGAALAAAGDVLMLGRPSSGPDFDRAAGVVPEQIEVVERWRSLWNGAVLSRDRIHAGTAIGVLGIGLLAGTGLRAVARAVDPGPLRKAAMASVSGFGVSGAATHVACAAVILAYRRTFAAGVDPAVGRRPEPEAATRLLALSAVGTLSSLAVLSSGLTVNALRRQDRVASLSPWATPFGCVLVTLLSFGRLPAPIGGYARPASISIGLMAYFCLAAISARETDDRRGTGWAS